MFFPLVLCWFFLANFSDPTPGSGGGNKLGDHAPANHLGNLRDMRYFHTAGPDQYKFLLDDGRDVLPKLKP